LKKKKGLKEGKMKEGGCTPEKFVSSTKKPCYYSVPSQLILGSYKGVVLPDLHVSNMVVEVCKFLREIRFAKGEQECI